MKFTEIANSLKDERRDFIKKICDVTQVYPSTVMRWINGEALPTARNRALIAEVLNMEPELLFPESINQES